MKPFFQLLCLCTLSLVGACADFEEPISVQNAEVATTSAQTRTGTTTFEMLPNPYALDVMQEIYDDFDGQTNLPVTDLYVRFKPQNPEQIEWLRARGLELFNYPLDVDIPQGVEYVDPTIPEGEPTWLYTTVKPNFTFLSGMP